LKRGGVRGGETGRSEALRLRSDRCCLDARRPGFACGTDYVVANLDIGLREITTMGFSEKIDPLLSRSVIEGGAYVCFTKGRVSPSFIQAFSRTLKHFKQTDAFQAIHRKYFP
jgi:hypothetical protein